MSPYPKRHQLLTPDTAGAAGKRDRAQLLVVVHQPAVVGVVAVLIGGLLGCWRRASARSIERGCTPIPKRSAMRSTSSPGRVDGSAARWAWTNSTTSADSLCAWRGPGLAGSSPGRPAWSRAAAAAYQLGRENPNDAAAAATAAPSWRTRRTISYLTWTRSRGSRNGEVANASSTTASGCGFRLLAAASASALGSGFLLLAILTSGINHRYVSRIVPSRAGLSSVRPIPSACYHWENGISSGSFPPAPSGSFSLKAESGLQLRHSWPYTPESSPARSRSRSPASSSSSPTCSGERPAATTTNGSTGPASVQPAGRPPMLPSPSKKNTRSSPQVVRRKAKSNSRPDSGWNGCVTRTRPGAPCGSPAVDDSVQYLRGALGRHGSA